MCQLCGECSVMLESLWPMDCSLPGSSVHRISQARTLEWAAISSSRGTSQPRDWTQVSCASCTGRRVLYHWATREAHTVLNIIKPFHLLLQLCMLAIVITPAQWRLRWREAVMCPRQAAVGPGSSPREPHSGAHLLSFQLNLTSKHTTHGAGGKSFSWYLHTQCSVSGTDSVPATFSTPF